MSSDLTFLTNEDDRKLSRRLNDLLSKSNRFDCLVGYFYLSGFYLIQKSLEPCEKIRILIGLQTEREVYQALAQSKLQPELEFRSQKETRKDFNDLVLNQLESAEESEKVETGINQFVRWCREGKVEVRAYDKQQIHAKLYIFNFDENQIDKGRVITGSSNLSLSGLDANLEFNVELKHRSDYDYASEKFEELWKESVEVSEEFVNTVTTRSHLAQFSPYELYLKFLYEYFRIELNQSRTLDQDYQPDNFLRLQYQQDAVLTAKRILGEFGGVFVADVVGLGKTYMAAMLARELFPGRCFIIAPPALLDPTNPGAWQNVFREFGVRGFDYESVGKINSIFKRDLSKYEYIIIDEAHRFRNEDTETYATLHRICRNKKVILVTATPFNNRPNDLLSQLKLFQDSRRSNLPNLPNLEGFFNNLNRRLRPFDRVDDREDYLRVMRENARDVRERVLKHLMVRRTRNEIAKFYSDDLAQQNLRFPEVEAPEPMFYKFSQEENSIFMETIRRISQEISYSRYRPLISTYYTGSITNVGTTAQNNLAAFMRILLVKRLESSFEAFKLTLGRFIKSYEHFISAFERGYVYVSKKRINQIFDLIADGDFDVIEKLVETEEAESYDAKLFKPAFRSDLENDLRVLKEIEKDWKKITRDPKWDEFKSDLQTDKILKKSKLLVFTESKETAEYLSKKIKNEIDEKVICFTGSSSKNLREEVIKNFDPRALDPKNDFRILVTTDSLAEGVSLHRSNVVMNYDIPWNPTRMMQRVGRVNRVDTKFEMVHTYNFFPTVESESAIGLQAAAEAKIEAFIEMLGTDAKLLTENEEVKSFSLFDRLTSKETITGESEDDEDSELKYLKIIREIQQNDEELFAHIKSLPRKARAARNPHTAESNSILPKNAVLTYFRIGKLDKLYLAEGKNKVRELDFIDAVKILETEDKEKQSIGKNFFQLLENNQTALIHFLHSDSETIYAPTSGRDVLTKLRRRLLVFKPDQMRGFTEVEENLWQDVIDALKRGGIAKKTVNAVWKSVEKTNDARMVLELLKKNFSFDEFAEEEVQNSKNLSGKQEVILSEHFL